MRLTSIFDDSFRRRGTKKKRTGLVQVGQWLGVIQKYVLAQYKEKLSNVLTGN